MTDKGCAESTDALCFHEVFKSYKCFSIIFNLQYGLLFDLQTFTDFYDPLDSTFNMASHGAYAGTDDAFKANRDTIHALASAQYADFTKCDIYAANWHFQRQDECYREANKLLNPDDLLGLGALGNADFFRTGAGAALFGTLGAGAAAGVPQGFTSGAGQIPAGVALPGAIGGGISFAAAPAFVAGVALLLVPTGLNAVTVFPPFESPRSPGFEDTVAVIHTEDEDQLLPRHLKRRKRDDFASDDIPSTKITQF